MFFFPGINQFIVWCHGLLDPSDHVSC